MGKLVVLQLSCYNESAINNIEIMSLILYGLLLSGGCANAYISFSTPEEITLRALEKALKEIYYQLYVLEQHKTTLKDYDVLQQQIVNDGMFDFEFALAHLNDTTVLQLEELMEIVNFQ